MSTTEKLLQLKQTVEDSKTKSTELKGERKGVLKDLATKWGCKTFESGRKKTTEMEKELKQLNEKLDEHMDELEEKYEL